MIQDTRMGAYYVHDVEVGEIFGNTDHGNFKMNKLQLGILENKSILTNKNDLAASPPLPAIFASREADR